MQIHRIHTRESVTFYTFNWILLKYATCGKARQLQSLGQAGLEEETDTSLTLNIFT